MKKTFFFISLAMVSVSLCAGKFNIGVEAGYDFSHYRSKTTETMYNGNVKTVTETYHHAKVIDYTVTTYINEKESSKHKESTSTGRLPQMHGFHIGPTFDWRFSDRMGLGLRFALNYQFLSTAGTIHDSKALREFHKGSHTYYHALNLPIRLSYTFNLPKDWHIWVMTGPKFDIGLSFKSKFDDLVLKKDPSDFGIEVKEFDYFKGELNGVEMEYGIDEYKYNRFTVSWGIGFGFGYKNFNFSATYDFGLSNLNAIKSKEFETSKIDYTEYNNQLQLTLSYTFPVKK